MYIVSACLAGVNCRYDGKNSLNSKIKKLVSQGKAIVVCPEELGGLPTPRSPCENKNNKVVSKKEEDFTEQFKQGAQLSLKIAQSANCKKAILKTMSPSCGYGKIYDGSFSHKIIKGNGVFADILEKNKFKIYTEENFINHIK